MKLKLLNLYTKEFNEVTLDELQEEYPKGWRKIVDQLMEDLSKSNWNREIVQIKEKFGELRVYVNDTSNEVYDRITAASFESLRTCQECGEPGSQRTIGWIRVLCDSCFSNKEVF